MTTSTIDLRTLKRLTSYILREDPDMPVSRLNVFLLVASKDYVLVSELVRQSGLNQSSVARALSVLGDKPARKRGDGLRWIKETPDPDDPRRNFYSLTPLGQRRLNEMMMLGDEAN